MKRTTCGACGSADLELFLDLGLTPIADAYSEWPDEEPACYPLQLAVCTTCWLVQLLEVVEHAVLFESGYSFYSSASQPLSVYHERYARDILQAEWPRRGGLAIEVGCNDGDFLRHLHAAGWHALGVDPAEGPVAVARDQGLEVVERPFGAAVAAELVAELGPAHLVVANHVLAHVESVDDVLAGVASLLAQDGTAYLEVQYLSDLLLNNAFDLVYHEHRNFFSYTALENALAQHGLSVVDLWFTDRQGGSVRAAVRHDGVTRFDRTALRGRELWLTDVAAYRGFQGRVDRLRDRIVDVVNDAAHMGRVWGYGAPAKATTLLTYCGLGHDQLDAVLDTTAAKQGRFIPGTGIPILPPERCDLDRVDTFLVTAWNYASKILRQHPDFRGSWVLPIPAAQVL